MCDRLYEKQYSVTMIIKRLTITLTCRSASPASDVSMIKFAGRDAGIPLLETPAPVTWTFFGSTEGRTLVLNGLEIQMEYKFRALQEKISIKIRHYGILDRNSHF